MHHADDEKKLDAYGMKNIPHTTKLHELRRVIAFNRKSCGHGTEQYQHWTGALYAIDALIGENGMYAVVGDVLVDDSEETNDE